VVTQRLDGVEAGLDPIRIEQRSAEPIAEPAAPERALGFVNHLDQRRPFEPVDVPRFEHLQGAERDRIEEHVLPGIVSGEVGEILETAGLAVGPDAAGVLGVREQRSDRADLRLARQRPLAEVRLYLPACRIEFERRALVGCHHTPRTERIGRSLGTDDRFGGVETLEFVGDGIETVEFGRVENRPYDTSK